MASANYFSSYISALNTGRIVENLTITQQSFSYNQSPMNFNCEFYGPFIFCRNSSAKKSEINYTIFVPYYLFQKDQSSQTLNVLPIYPGILMSFQFLFPSLQSMNEWFLQIYRIRMIVRTFQGIIPPIGIQASIFVEQIKSSTIITPFPDKLALEGEVKNQILTGSSQRKLDKSMRITGVFDPSEVKLYGSLYSFALVGQNLPKCFLKFEDPEGFMYTFASIYLSLEAMKIDKNKPSIIEPSIAAIPKRSESGLIWNFSITFHSHVNPIPLPKLHLIQLSRKQVAVPEKARSIVLVFDLPMKRNVLVQTESKMERKKRQQKQITKASRSGYLFNFYASSIRKEFLQFRNPLTLPSRNPNSAQIMLDDSQQEFFKSREMDIKFNTSAEVATLCERLQIPQIASFSRPGEKALSKLSTMAKALPASIFAGSRQFVEFCSFVSSIICDLSSASAIFELLPSLFKNEPMLLSSIPTAKVGPFQNITVFIGRIIRLNLMDHFLTQIIADRLWRRKAYFLSSLMLNTEFVESMMIILDSVKTKIYGEMSADGAQPVFGIEDPSARIPAIARSIMESQMEGADPGKFARIYGLLISNICEFFSQGFKPPRSSIIKQMRHCWYLFNIASSAQIKGDEMVQFRASVESAISSKSSDPARLLAHCFLGGLNCGVAWSFVLFACAYPNIRQLYADGSPALRVEKVLEMANSLYALKWTSIEIDFSRMMEHICAFCQK